MYKNNKKGNNSNSSQIFEGGRDKLNQLYTFEDIFNRLCEEYQGEKVQVVTKQDGVKIACFKIFIDRIDIKPLNKTQSKKWSKNGEKIGLIRVKNKSRNTIIIPFLLGFNTMKAVFLKNGAVINTMNMEFILKKTGKKITA